MRSLIAASNRDLQSDPGYNCFTPLCSYFPAPLAFYLVRQELFEEPHS